MKVVMQVLLLLFSVHSSTQVDTAADTFLTILFIIFEKQINERTIQIKNIFLGFTWPRGPMDKASDFESEDCGFESHRGRFRTSYS